MPKIEAIGSVRLHGMLGDKNASAIAFLKERALIGDLPIPLSGAGDHELLAKPEGVAVIKETSDDWELLIVFDGLEDGHATRYRVEKPPH